MVAEQIAMADLISGGRCISGFVRGVGVETLVGEHATRSTTASASRSATT